VFGVHADGFVAAQCDHVGAGFGRLDVHDEPAGAG